MASSHHGKVILMAAFILADIGFNSSLDYDTYNDSIDRNYKLGFFGLQVTLQICIFLTLFLAAADTFLFRIGSSCFSCFSFVGSRAALGSLIYVGQ